MNAGGGGEAKTQDCLVWLPDGETKKIVFRIVPIEAVTGYNSD